MIEFFSSMDIASRVYWYIAIGASLFFVIQTILTFIGSASDMDVHDGSDGFDSISQLFSLRNLVSFLLGFGWTGVALYNSIESQWLLLFIAVLVGLLFVAIFFFVIKTLLKLSEDNSFRIEDTLDKTGDVYMQIPANKSGKGKILISVKGSTHELSAITEDSEPIKVGKFVKVVKVENKILTVTAQ